MVAQGIETRTPRGSMATKIAAGSYYPTADRLRSADSYRSIWLLAVGGFAVAGTPGSFAPAHSKREQGRSAPQPPLDRDLTVVRCRPSSNAG